MQSTDVPAMADDVEVLSQNEYLHQDEGFVGLMLVQM